MLCKAQALFLECCHFSTRGGGQSRSLCPEEPLIPRAGRAGGARSRQELSFGLLASGNFPPVALELQDHGSSFCTNRAEGKERENLTLPTATGIKPVGFGGIRWALQPLVPPGACRTCCWQLSITPSMGLVPRDMDLIPGFPSPP